MRNLHPDCPDEIKSNQRLITLQYYSFDGKVHQGQLLIDYRLVKDIQHVFNIALKQQFPIRSVVPLADRRFVVNGRWDDDQSMSFNNTSAFNYRAVTGGKKLSNHANGFAIDINPMQNPYIKGRLILPKQAQYNPDVAGTLTEDHPIVKAFINLGWTWGGHWKTLKDYQHFEKVLE